MVRDRGFEDITTVGVAWGDDYVRRTLNAIIFGEKQCGFGSRTLICPAEQADPYHRLMDEYHIGHYHIEPMTSREFSRFMIEDLHLIANTDYLLNIQHDTAIIDRGMWEPEFFSYDYIGSPWKKSCGFQNRVGNGGFSLRSKRFLQASSDLVYEPLTDIDFHEHAHEDWFLCVKNYHVLMKKGVVFAPVEVAARFSVEHPIYEKSYDPLDLSTYDAFGFHGSFNQAGYRLLSDNLETEQV